MIRLEPARPADRPAIDAFLAERADSSMFFLSNMFRAGLAWDGGRFQAQYMLAWDGDALAGIVGHAWNGMMMVQAGAYAGPLAAATAALSGRAVVGFTGPLDQVKAARAALGLDGAPARLDHDETLMALSLDALIVPPALAGGRVQVRQATAADRDPLVAWRADYLVDLNGSPPGPDTDAEAARWFELAVAEHNCWLVLADGAPAAITQFNARVPSHAQVGGVYTPPALRGRGHARTAVAASLLDARADGVNRAILFTPRPDALAAYRAIGFSVIGTFGIVLLALDDRRE